MNDWHISTYSNGGSNCVEARATRDGADVRDSQHRELGHITFPAAEWAAFLQGIQADRL
ncbi:DUF397 domain-containing protein [Marinactinospora rubrisoli]|uniref:DUF397 domain-containing protein n=1 Tax=Marinactinospora rubrisoli TaxID=2715399 RepID=A0ABW2KD22_9ACTN